MDVLQMLHYLHTAILLTVCCVRLMKPQPNSCVCHAGFTLGTIHSQTAADQPAASAAQRMSCCNTCKSTRRMTVHLLPVRLREIVFLELSSQVIQFPQVRPDILLCLHCKLLHDFKMYWPSTFALAVIKESSSGAAVCTFYDPLAVASQRTIPPQTKVSRRNSG